jgi:hypothetical protein
MDTYGQKLLTFKSNCFKFFFLLKLNAFPLKRKKPVNFLVRKPLTLLPRLSPRRGNVPFGMRLGLINLESYINLKAIIQLLLIKEGTNSDIASLPFLKKKCYF